MISGNRLLTLLALSLLIAGTVSPVSAFDSQHASMLLVWNAGSFDCDTVDMTLIADGVWECSAPVARADTYYFQFWPGSGLDPKYGADVLSPGSLVYDDDPSQVPVELDTNGYYYFRFDESLLTYEVVVATGSIQLQVLFNDHPIVTPTGTGAEVVDATLGAVLGFYAVGPGDIVPIDNLIPGRTYDLTVTADGYDPASLSSPVTDETPVDLEVTLEKSVGNQNNSWSGIKALYR